MTPSKWLDIIDELKGQGIDFAPALTDADVVSIERKFSFRFPPDLRALLQAAVPQGEQFPDWLSRSERSFATGSLFRERGYSST